MRPDQRFERDVLRSRAQFGTRPARASGALSWEKGDSRGDPCYHFQMKHSIGEYVTLDHEELVKTQREADRLWLTPVVVVRCTAGTAYLLPGDDWQEDWGDIRYKRIRDFHERGVLWHGDVWQIHQQLPADPKLDLQEFEDGSTVQEIARQWRTTLSSTTQVLLRGLAAGAVQRRGSRYYHTERSA